MGKKHENHVKNDLGKIEFGCQEGLITLIWWGLEEPLDELSVYDAVINSQDMKLRLCGQTHFLQIQDRNSRIREKQEQADEKGKKEDIYERIFFCFLFVLQQKLSLVFLFLWFFLPLLVCLVGWEVSKKWEGKMSCFLLIYKTHQNPQPHKADLTRFRPKIFPQFFSARVDFLNYKASNAK